MNINCAWLDFGFARPTSRDQIFATVHDVRRPHEMQKQSELQGGETHGVTVAGDPDRRDVHLYIRVAENQLGRSSRARIVWQFRMQPLQQGEQHDRFEGAE
ncbi:hypothetical protein AOX55_00005394 (plasmid) [Sinorhizobium fredii CCBAU 25509]|nr:hypothetical protein AOX55_00005394 [Sinorhizobium fredii CCBAU 25509]